MKPQCINCPVRVAINYLNTTYKGGNDDENLEPEINKFDYVPKTDTIEKDETVCRNAEYLLSYHYLRYSRLKLMLQNKQDNSSTTNIILEHFSNLSGKNHNDFILMMEKQIMNYDKIQMEFTLLCKAVSELCYYIMAKLNGEYKKKNHKNLNITLPVCPISEKVIINPLSDNWILKINEIIDYLLRLNISSLIDSEIKLPNIQKIKTTPRYIKSNEKFPLLPPTASPDILLEICDQIIEQEKQVYEYLIDIEKQGCIVSNIIAKLTNYTIQLTKKL